MSEFRTSGQVKVESMKIYLQEMKELARGLREVNEESIEALEDRGHSDIREAVRAFQMSFVTKKIQSTLP